MTNSEPLLRVTGLAKQYMGTRALDGATLAVERGSITALIGPNGAGKSTLFGIVSGFQRADQGSVTFDGHSITRLSAFRIARRGLVRTFQITKALTKLSVIDNLRVAASRHPGESLRGVWMQPLRGRRREREINANAEKLLQIFGLERVALDYAGTLSGGQRKLLEFARALMAEPKIILLDEPLAGINPTLGNEILGYMQLLRRSLGMTFFFVEHDMNAVMTCSDLVIVMSAGRVIATGTPGEIRRNPEVIDAYLGMPAKP